ncbi:MAG TPA: hypothetical protein PK507_02595, partial [bacterium]|nr:hypothetical protein [bacterium]
MPNSYKEDLKLMLGKLTNMIGSNDSTNESILSNIYNDFDSLNPVDQFVVREYVSDCINEILEAKKINTDSDTKAVEATTTILSANCRIVPGTDGKFYVYDEDKIVGSYDNEADARSFVNAQQKNTLVSADEEVMDEPDELTEEDASVDEEVVEEDEEAPEMDELRQILEDADNILSIIDSNIKMTTDLDTVVKMIVQEDAITTKKENLEEADPSDPKIKDMINQFRDFLDQVELESIDLINKNAPGADIESEDVAEEENEKIEDIEDKIEEEMKKEEETEVNEEEKTSIKEDTSFEDEAKAITDEKELLSKDIEEDIEEDIEVETLEKEPSIDAPDAEDINEVLGDFEDEEFEFIDEDEEVLDETTESPVETIEEIDNLIDKLMDLITDEVENEEVTEEAEEIKKEIQENLDKVEASVEELPVEDEEFEDIVFDEEEAPVEDIEELPVEEELEEELTEEELEDEEEKAVEEAKILNEISEEDLHKVDFPGGTGAD